MSDSSREQFLRELSSFFSDAAICRDSFPILVHFAIRLAAAGQAPAVLVIVERSPEAALFAPLAAGLRLHLGQQINEVGDTLNLAHEIARKIVEAVSAYHDERVVA